MQAIRFDRSVDTAMAPVRYTIQVPSFACGMPLAFHSRLFCCAWGYLTTIMMDSASSCCRETSGSGQSSGLSHRQYSNGVHDSDAAAAPALLPQRSVHLGALAARTGIAFSSAWHKWCQHCLSCCNSLKVWPDNRCVHDCNYLAECKVYMALVNHLFARSTRLS